MTDFHGIFPYLVSPIDEANGRVRERVLRDLVEHLIGCGVHGLSPLGSTGEFAYLSFEQRQEIVRIVVDAAAGRVPVLAGVAAFSTSDALRQAEAHARLGADGLILILQQMFPLPPRGIERYFAAVAEALPQTSMTLYTNPGLLGGDIPMDVLDALSHVPNIEYVKDASGNTGRILTMLNRMGERVRVFSASAHIPLLVLQLGGVGWMAGPGVRHAARMRAPVRSGPCRRMGEGAAGAAPAMGHQRSVRQIRAGGMHQDRAAAAGLRRRRRDRAAAGAQARGGRGDQARAGAIKVARQPCFLYGYESHPYRKHGY